MPRKGPAVKHEIEPDPIYQNPLVTQLINKILLDGKKTVAERIVYKALEDISERTSNDPVITLKRAVENARPLLEVRSRRVVEPSTPWEVLDVDWFAEADLPPLSAGHSCKR